MNHFRNISHEFVSLSSILVKDGIKTVQRCNDSITMSPVFINSNDFRNVYFNAILFLELLLY